MTALSEIKNLQELAVALDIKSHQLTWWAWKLGDQKRYRSFTVKKKSGKLRSINVPAPTLKMIQRRVLVLLSEEFEDKIIDSPSHGFIAGRSIVTNASVHLDKKWVLNVDLKDFFPSITRRRLWGLLTKEPFAIEATVAGAILQLCCLEDGTLPQGAPTSPLLSNMIGHHLDISLRRLAERYQCNYTRYADDLTFSTDADDFPAPLARYPMTMGTTQVVVGPELKNRIHSNTFQINYEKARLQDTRTRQSVTGVIVNNATPNVPRQYLKNVRRELHIWKKHGLVNSSSWWWARHGDLQTYRKRSPEYRYVRTVQGMVAHIRHVRRTNRTEDLLAEKYVSELEFLLERDSSLVTDD